MSDLTAVSLFAGVGGFDLALERAGVDVRAAVEIDPAARGVLADRFPKTTLFADVTEVTGDQLRATGFVPERGILTAGWPCQGNSVAGARGGMADPRSGLWRHVVRLLAETRPRWFVGENVPGLLTVNDGDDLAVVRQDLAQLGYWWAERVVDAQYFGVPQRRRRIAFVGCLGDRSSAVQVLLEPEGGGRDSSAGQSTQPGVAATLTAGAARPGVSAPGRRQEDDVNLVIASALTATGVGTCGADDNQAQAGHLVTFQKVVRSGERDAEGNLPPEVWAERPVAATLNLNDLGSESRAVELVVTATGETTHTLTSEGADASEDGTGRGTPVIAFAWQAGGNKDASGAFSEELSPTLPKSQTMAVQNEMGVRRLTPLECERLQGFPDGWTLTSNGTPQADSPRYKQMGNAIAVPVFAWITRRITAVSA